MESTTDIKVMLENHTTRLDVIERDIAKLSTIVVSVQDLTLSVNKMAMTMENMLEEQKRQSGRIQSLEEEPSNNWKLVKKTIITSMVSALAGAAVVAIVMLMVKFNTL